MNNEEIILRGIDEIPMFTFNTETKEFSVLGHKFEGVNSIEDFINYIHNLDKENQQLKEKVNQLETSIATKDSELLQLKEELRQLKTNIDKAIEILNFRSHSNDIELNMLHNLRMMNKAIEILKGGSNE